MNKSKNSRKQESVTPVVEESHQEVSKEVRKKSVKKEEPKEQVVQEPTVEVTLEVQDKRKLKKKSKNSETVEVTETQPVQTEDAAETTTTKKSKREVTRDSVETEFNDLLVLIKEGIDASAADKKNGGSKTLKTLQKRLKLLKSDCLKISKGKPRVHRSQNTTSGFMKPVKISKDLAKFTGWDVEQPRSRVDATKFICDYIKENNLQNEKDRRQILPDAKLCKLLSYDPKKEDKPLTYYYLQKKIQPHFTSLEATVTN